MYKRKPDKTGNVLRFYADSSEMHTIGMPQNPGQVNSDRWRIHNVIGDRA